MNDDLWGTLPTPSNNRTPHSILLEQGELLTKKTQGLLVERVTRSVASGTFKNLLSINAPSLSYNYGLVRVDHSILQYPVAVFNLNDALGSYVPDECNDEVTFTAALRKILGDQTTRHVISSLLAQIENGIG